MVESHRMSEPSTLPLKVFSGGVGEICCHSLEDGRFSLAQLRTAVGTGGAVGEQRESFLLLQFEYT